MATFSEHCDDGSSGSLCIFTNRVIITCCALWAKLPLKHHPLVPNQLPSFFEMKNLSLNKTLCLMPSGSIVIEKNEDTEVNMPEKDDCKLMKGEWEAFWQGFVLQSMLLTHWKGSCTGTERHTELKKKELATLERNGSLLLEDKKPQWNSDTLIITGGRKTTKTLNWDYLLYSICPILGVQSLQRNLYCKRVY